MATALRKLRITKVDLCGAGANPDADIVIFKSRDTETPVDKRDIPASHRHEMPRADFAGPHESYPIEEPGDVESAARLIGHAQNPDAVKRRIISIARRMGPSFVARLPESWTVKKEDTSVPKFVIRKPADVAKATPEELRDYTADLEKSLEEQEKALAKAGDPAEPDEDDQPAPKGKKAVKKDDGDDMMKSLPEPVRKQIEESNKRAEEALAKANTLQSELEKSREATAMAEIRKTVETVYKHVPGDAAKLADLYRVVEKSTPEAFETLKTVLKAANEAIQKAATEVGSSKGASVGSAQEELFAMADDMVEKKVCKTRPEAINKVAKENPDLYTRYKAEQKSGR